MDRTAPHAVAAADRALREAELWATMASLLGGQYPHAALARAGSLIGEGGWSLALGDELTPELLDLLVSCRSAYDRAIELREHSFEHIASHAKTAGQGQPVIVFNGAASPRSGTVWLRHEWPVPGVRALAVIDEWDRQVRPALDHVRYHPDSTIAAAWVGWPARDVPSVGFRTFHLVPDAVAPRPPSRFDPPNLSGPRPQTAATQPPGNEEDARQVLPPLRARTTARHDGHLPSSFSLLSLQPAGEVTLAGVSLTADGALRIRVREAIGRHCRAELRMFVPFPDEVQVVELGPRQLATVTGVAEQPAWAPPGPPLSPPADTAPTGAGAASTEAGAASTEAGAVTAGDPPAVDITLDQVEVVAGGRGEIPVTVTGDGDGPVRVQVVAPSALWPMLPRRVGEVVLRDGAATVEIPLSPPPSAAPVLTWLAVRAGRPEQGYGEQQFTNVRVTRPDES